MRRKIRMVRRTSFFAIAGLLAGSLVSGTVASAPPASAATRLTVLNVHEPDDLGVDHATGVVSGGRSGPVYVLDRGQVVALGAGGRGTAAGVVPASAVARPASYDTTRARLIALSPDGKLIIVAERKGGGFDPSTPPQSQSPSRSLRAVTSIAVDPDSGDVLAVDGTSKLLRVTPTIDGGARAAVVTGLDLSAAAGGEFVAVAIDPSTRHIHVLSRSPRRLYELAADGRLVASRDATLLGDLAVPNMAFGPSVDSTDSPATQSLFVTGTAGAGSGVLELSLSAPAASVAQFASTPIRTTTTSSWSQPSPDPSGLHYVAGSNRLVMVDGEVEETINGITHFTGANLWEMSLDGTVLRTANISKIAPTVVPMTNEPTGVAYDAANQRYFFSDDGSLRIWNLNPGADKLVGTADDRYTYFDTGAAGNNDPEGVAYDSWNNRVAVADGVNAEVYLYTPAGALVGRFDVSQYGVVDPESVEFDSTSGTLHVLSNAGNRVIVETTMDGALLRSIDYSAVDVIAPAGLAIAPASDASGSRRYYLVDRAVDNDSDPSIVDGQLIELTAPAPLDTGFNVPPTVEAGAEQTVVLPGSATLDATVTDDGRPDPPTLTYSWSLDSGPAAVTFDDPTAVDTTVHFVAPGAYLLRLTASDGALTGSDLVGITVSGVGSVAVFDTRVSTGTDDAEESATGGMTMGSADLELVYDGSNQVVGIRFNGIPIPQGAQIDTAYVQFQTDEVQGEATSLVIRGQDADNAPAFVSVSRNISSRTRTTASVGWTPAAWTIVGAELADQRTPNLTAIVQEIVDRPGWVSGGSMAIIITGTGHRTARAFEFGGAASAALLHVAWQTTLPNTAPAVNAGPDDTITFPASVSLHGTVSDDGLPTPAALTTTWTTVSGPGTVTFADANAVDTTASFSTSGSYVLRLTGDDSVLSASDDITVTVNPIPLPNSAPVVDAGPDATITLPASVSLHGTVSDDGLPTPAALTTTWTVVSGPGTVVFANSNAVDTTASFSASGSYVLRLTGTDSVLSASDDITVTVNAVPDGIFADGFESGTLANWSLTTSPTADLTPTPGSARAGNYGLQVTVGDNSPAYVTDNSPTAEPRYRARFYVNLASMTMAKNDLHRIFSIVTSNGTEVGRVEIRFSAKSQYQVRISALNDGGSTLNGGWTVISKTWHGVEIDWRASSAPGANSGALSLWVDGTPVSTIDRIDNDAQRIEFARLGAAQGIDSGTRGTYSFDAFESRRLTYIGM